MRTKDDALVEPDFLSQTGGEAGRVWLYEQARAAAEQGATYHRFSIDDKDHPRIWLYEGWKVRPANEGEPRFMLQRGEL